MNDVFASRATQFQPVEEVDIVMKQTKQDIRRTQFSLVGKLANKEIFFKKDNYLVCQILHQRQIQFDIQQFMDRRPLRQREVQKFKQSILDKNDIGYYFLYNWISNKKYCCKQPTEGPALLAFYVINQQFEKAKNYCEKLPGSLELSIIKNILKKFAKLQLLIKGPQKPNTIYFSGSRVRSDTVTRQAEKAQKIQKLFFRRELFEIQLSSQSSSSKEKQTGIPIQYHNLFENSSCYHNLNEQEKISQLRQNYFSIISFSRQISKDNIQNDYYKVILTFVSNVNDTKKQNPFKTLLLELKNLQLSDRLNFAQKLLTLEQKAKFVLELKNVLCLLPDINNLFFYDVGTDEILIKRIFQNYLDQYGDLKTIAQLSLLHYKLPSLKEYIDNYLQMLRYSYDDKELQRIQNIIFEEKYENSNDNKRISYLDYRFFDRIKLQQQKIIDLDIQELQKAKYDKKIAVKKFSQSRSASKFINTQSKKTFKQFFQKSQEDEDQVNIGRFQPLCIVCYQTSNNSAQLYIQCDKCKHGGHISHILAWLQKFQNCPKIDCPCKCN